MIHFLDNLYWDEGGEVGEDQVEEEERTGVQEEEEMMEVQQEEEEEMTGV